MSESEEGEDVLRLVMRRWATGVALVAAAEDNAFHGMTVNSFTALSLQPPLVLVALERGSRTHDMVVRCQAYAVTILAEDQEDLAERFAGQRPEDRSRFEGLSVRTGPTGSPYLQDGIAYLDCRVLGVHPAGTHTVFMGEAVAAALLRAARPLLYYNRGYRTLSE